MEKFSLYDLLSVLLPGVYFTYMLDEIRNMFGWLPLYSLSAQWEVLIILSIFFGAMIYIISFWLVSHCKWFYRILGMHQNITTLYYKTNMNHVFANTLNKKANEWYEHRIFLDADEFKSLSSEETSKITDEQDSFYERMYYELDYSHKLDVPKSFQSYYFFFRNVFLASIVSFIIQCIAFLFSMNPEVQCNELNWTKIIPLSSVLIGAMFISLFIARWYRQRMVHKMYWFFYTHINSQK